MKVIMKDNLIERYMKNFPYDSSLDDEEDITFLRRIEEEVINLIFTHGDAFEEMIMIYGYLIIYGRKYEQPSIY